MVPIFAITSSRDMPMPLSETVIVRASLSNATRIRSSPSPSNRAGAAIASNRSLSAASEAFDTSSRRNTSLLPYSECTIRCRSCFTSAWKSRVSVAGAVMGFASGSDVAEIGAEVSPIKPRRVQSAPPDDLRPLQLSEDFLAGARACLPATPGVAAFGVIMGVATVGAGLSPWLAVVMTVIVYAGTAQLAALQLFVAGAPLPIILIAGLILNIRFVLYSLAVAPHVARGSARRRLALAYLLSDNGYGHFAARYSGAADASGKVDYLLGSCSAVWVAWNAGTIAGVAAGARVPAGWHLEFVVTLTFLALAIAVIRDRALAAAALASGVTAMLAYPLPFRLGLSAAAAVGIAAGLVWERWRR